MLIGHEEENNDASATAQGILKVAVPSGLIDHANRAFPRGIAISAI